MRALLAVLSCLALAGEAAAILLKPSDIAGRWHGHMVSPGACEETACDLTFDIVPCGTRWCGIRVSETNACAGHVLTLDAGEPDTPTEGSLTGALSLAAGAEPYVVKVDLDPSREESGGLLLSFRGATAAVFPFLDRDFPMSAVLARTGAAECKLERPVS
jgi:hypothetical protein